MGAWAGAGAGALGLASKYTVYTIGTGYVHPASLPLGPQPISAGAQFFEVLAEPWLLGF